MIPIPRVTHLVVDVTDLDRAVAFWSALLGVQVGQRGPAWADLAPLGEGGPVLSFQAVPEAKAVKNRLHLDLAVDEAGGGVVAAGERARALGGAPASELFGDDAAGWQIWRDPEGNEFCLVTAVRESAPAGA